MREIPQPARVVAVIPARGGSKGVPGKNLARVGGRPLVERAVRACRAAERVDLVVVSTDSDEIAAVARAAGARVVARPASLSGDEASSESALLHALDVLTTEQPDPEVTVLVQCTSPFLDAADLDAAVKQVQAGDLDCCFAALTTHELLWRGDDRTVRGVNHDGGARRRRQDVQPDHRETGAFYALRTASLREHGHRFCGRVGVQSVRAATALEIDAPEDLELARALALVVDPQLDRPMDVDAVVTDFDGVHTDDRVCVNEHGVESVTVSRSDGMGVARLRRAGVRVLILSTETNPVVSARARKLGVPVLQGVDDKQRALVAWMADEGLDPQRVAYVGNDVNDLEALSSVGWPVVVPDAPPRVRAVARVVLARPGGHGAVRDVSDRVLAAKGS
jgi:N-acylneuraminate cytidylyltransferase